MLPLVGHLRPPESLNRNILEGLWKDIKKRVLKLNISSGGVHGYMCNGLVNHNYLGKISKRKTVKNNNHRAIVSMGIATVHTFNIKFILC